MNIVTHSYEFMHHRRISRVLVAAVIAFAIGWIGLCSDKINIDIEENADTTTTSNKISDKINIEKSTSETAKNNLLFQLPLCKPLNLTAVQEGIICLPKCDPSAADEGSLHPNEKINLTVQTNRDKYPGEYGKYRIHFPEEEIYLHVDGREYKKGGEAMHPRSVTERLFRRVIAKLFRAGVLDPTKNIINTGSWIGDNALPWAMMLEQLTTKPGKVIAVDPSPMYVNNMVNTAHLNLIGNVCTHVTVYSAKKGTVFTSTTEHMGVNLGLKRGEKQINMITLDSENITNLALLHIDVEGHESELLTGAMDLIKTSRPVIVTEGVSGLTDSNDKKVAEILRSLDYVHESSEIPEICGWNKSCRNHIWWPDQDMKDSAMKVIGNDLSRSEIVPWVSSELL